LFRPALVFAVFGSSRHLVVSADSATAAMVAAGLTSLSFTANTPKYVALTSLIGLVAAGILLLARILRLGFLADFLSRTVLVGFLSGVGVQVALGGLLEMLGIGKGGHGFTGVTASKAPGKRGARIFKPAMMARTANAISKLASCVSDRWWKVNRSWRRNPWPPFSMPSISGSSPKATGTPTPEKKPTRTVRDRKSARKPKRRILASRSMPAATRPMRLVSATYFGVLAVNDREVRPAATIAAVAESALTTRWRE